MRESRVFLIALPIGRTAARTVMGGLVAEANSTFGGSEIDDEGLIKCVR